MTAYNTHPGGHYAHPVIHQTHARGSQTQAVHQTQPGGNQTQPGGHQTQPGGHQTQPGGHQTGGHQTQAGDYKALPGGRSVPPLIHTASSPALVRRASGRNLIRPPAPPAPHTPVYIHSMSQPSQSVSSPNYITTHGQVPRSHGNTNNPDYMSRSEMSHIQVAPPSAYSSSTASPANSSSGYSSGNTQAGSTYSYNPQSGQNHGDLPPPPPPHAPITSQSPPPPPPPPPPVPPPNPDMGSRTQNCHYLSVTAIPQQRSTSQYF